MASILLVRSLIAVLFDFGIYYNYYGDGIISLSSLACDFLIFVCCIASLIIVCRSSSNNPPKVWVKSVVAWLLIGCVGGTATASFMELHGWIYIDYMVGAVALAIDVRYIGREE